MTGVPLSSADVREIISRASRNGGDMQRATEEVVREKTAKRDAANQTYYAQRKKEDAEKIRDVGAWPMSHLPLKTQPWITNETGRMRFALIHCTDLLTVIEEGKAPVTFASIEEIVETWSVD